MIEQSPQRGSSLEVREIFEAVGKSNAGPNLQESKSEASEGRNSQHLAHC